MTHQTSLGLHTGIVRFLAADEKIIESEKSTCRCKGFCAYELCCLYKSSKKNPGKILGKVDLCVDLVVESGRISLLIVIEWDERHAFINRPIPTRN
jgi:hypothetical protein